MQSENTKLSAAEIQQRKQTFEVLDKAYDLVVEYYRTSRMNRDDFKRHFSGIADDYRMAKLAHDVAQQEVEKFV